MGMTKRPDTGLPASATRPSETLHRSLSLRNSFTIGFVTITPGYRDQLGPEFHGELH